MDSYLVYPRPTPNGREEVFDPRLVGRDREACGSLVEELGQFRPVSVWTYIPDVITVDGNESDPNPGAVMLKR